MRSTATFSQASHFFFGMQLAVVLDMEPAAKSVGACFAAQPCSQLGSERFTAPLLSRGKGFFGVREGER